MSNIDRGSFNQAEYDRRFHGDFMYDATIEDDDGGSARSPLFIILTVLVLMAFAAVVWVAYQQGMKQGDRGAPPIIAAEPGPIRVAPENPGGVTVPDQDKQIYERIAGTAGVEETAEALGAPPETPQDLPEAPKEQPVAIVPATPPAETVETPGAAEAGEQALVTPEGETAPPAAAQVEAEEAAKKQAAEITSQIEAIDPGAADAAAKTASATAGAFVVQVGAFKSDVEAAEKWQALKKKNGDLLGALKPDIKRVDLDSKGVWYRLRVGPFETRANAVALCEVLRTRGGNCIVGKP
jgi:cell division protein FtsN